MITKIENVIVKLSFALLIVLGVDSCTLDIPPADQYADPDAIIDVKTARAYLTTSYIEFPHIQYELSVLANDFCMTENTRCDVEIKNLYLWKHKNIKEMSESLWLEYYRVIADLDALEERILDINLVTEDDRVKKNQIVAEMYTLKAMAYFNILRLYAPKYSDNSEANGLIIKKFLGIEYNKRTSIPESVEFISHLLEEAKQNIFSREDLGSSFRYGWLTKEAVEYFQAEIALYKGDYNSVISISKSLLEKAPHEVDDCTTLWTKGNPDIIFAFNTRKIYYADLEYDKELGDYFGLNPEFVLEESDVRTPSYVYSTISSRATFQTSSQLSSKGSSKELFGKYNMALKDGKEISYIDNIRYSALYFMLAESYARLGNNNEARSIINKYLSMVNSILIGDNISGQKLVEAILNEKYKEFAGEGRNYFDLKRIGKDLKKKGIWNTSGIKLSADDYKWTFPIPSTELRYNQVQQNKGW